MICDLRDVKVANPSTDSRFYYAVKGLATFEPQPSEPFAYLSTKINGEKEKSPCINWLVSAPGGSLYFCSAEQGITDSGTKRAGQERESHYL